MTAMTIHHLHTHLGASTRASADGSASWRWEARRLLTDVRDLLLADALADAPATADGWLAARGQGMDRERSLLLARLAAAASRTLHEPTVERVSADLDRLLVDVDHHLQRRRDLAWDEVELELGGSE